MLRIAAITAIMIMIASGQAPATSIKQVSVYDLFEEADIVAFLYITAGTGEDYDKAVYKARIVTPFKGVNKGDIIYFGPFASYGIGNEYLAFLKRTSLLLGDLKRDNVTDPIFKNGSSEAYYSAMYSGYSMMPVSYTCALPECDYGVKVAYQQVVFPEKIPRSETGCPEGAAEKVWFYKNSVHKHLLKLTGTTVE
jgi:hypothetical protein